MNIANKVSGLSVRDIVSGIYVLEGAERRGGDISFTVDIRGNEGRFAKGMIALAGISNSQAATDMSYQLRDPFFDLSDGKVRVQFKADVGDTDGYLDRVSYVIFIYS